MRNFWKSNIFLIVAGLALGSSAYREIKPEKAPRMKLSEYGFFHGVLSDMQPAERVIPYEVNAPLFTDYAEKKRFVFLPEGGKMIYYENEAWDLPEGGVIIKNFYYFNETPHPEKGKKILETRLLIREKKGWNALTYIWNESQTDAVLEVAGASLPHSWIDANGKKRSFNYGVPNVNQCKGCHSYSGKFTPIGLSTRQLNNGLTDNNQLLAWQNQGLLDLPDGFTPAASPHLTNYRDVNADLDHRARAYLDANCAHCHNPTGPASTSGMFLQFDQPDPERIGIGKPPVAAGRGSGKRKFGIVPGRPDESILLYRMEHSDPGIRMPEIGRELTHQEGVDLIKKWITALPHGK